MDIKILQNIFFYLLVINIGIYTLTVMAVLCCRKFICRINTKIFAVEESKMNEFFFLYIALYKLLITMFCFTPWLAIKLSSC